MSPFIYLVRWQASTCLIAEKLSNSLRSSTVFMGSSVITRQSLRDRSVERGGGGGGVGYEKFGVGH